jgi:hypothetical protein
MPGGSPNAAFASGEIASPEAGVTETKDFPYPVGEVRRDQVQGERLELVTRDEAGSAMKDSIVQQSAEQVFELGWADAAGQGQEAAGGLQVELAKGP